MDFIGGLNKKECSKFVTGYYSKYSGNVTMSFYAEDIPSNLQEDCLQKNSGTNIYNTQRVLFLH